MKKRKRVITISGVIIATLIVALFMAVAGYLFLNR
jgi:hypothetical protein